MTHAAVLASEPKMQRGLEAMERDFAGFRTSRASTTLVERIAVDYYGNPTPLNQLASISVPDPHLIVIVQVVGVVHPRVQGVVAAQRDRVRRVVTDPEHRNRDRDHAEAD